MAEDTKQRADGSTRKNSRQKGGNRRVGLAPQEPDGGIENEPNATGRTQEEGGRGRRREAVADRRKSRAFFKNEATDLLDNNRSALGRIRNEATVWGEREGLKSEC